MDLYVCTLFGSFLSLLTALCGGVATQAMFRLAQPAVVCAATVTLHLVQAHTTKPHR
jgi:hypothetical protein